MNQPDRMCDLPLWCPQQIEVIGGGLWSRVIVETLCKLVPENVEIGINSPRSYQVLRDWADRMELHDRVRVSASWPELNGDKTKAVIIANAARDHASAVERILPSRVPVLVEKPFTLTATETQHLTALAAKTEGRLAASHVFLFTRYLDNFITMLAEEGLIVKIAFRWTDPQKEIRHGDRKSYDPGLPLHVDVLPHISSMVGALLPGTPIQCAGLSVFNGGAKLEVRANLGDIPCTIDMARNATRRERVIEVSTVRRVITLDFTAEPRVILEDGVTISADPDWGKLEGPLASMLRVYLTGANNGLFDSRLSIEKALQGNAFADQVSVFYKKTISEWLLESLPSQCRGTEDGLRYALRELFFSSGQIVALEVEMHVEEALRKLHGANLGKVIDFIGQKV